MERVIGLPFVFFTMRTIYEILKKKKDKKQKIQF